MTNQEFWQTVLGEIELQISKPSFVTWLKNSELIDRQNGVALVGLPSNFAKEWAEKHYEKLILGSLRGRDETTRKVEFVVSQKHRERSASTAAAVAAPTYQLLLSEFNVDPETNLNPRYTFASFVVGSSNEMANAAAQAVIRELGKKYNPLFLYGGVGVGKTHLIQAIGNEIKKAYQNQAKVRYVPSEKFVNDVVWAMRNKRMETIKEKYRFVDVLIIDDIQFIGGKKRTEEEFFHTFNALYENNKQIILSSDRSPRFLPTLSERLRSRFEGGMTCDIGYPDYELRLAVLRSRLQEESIPLEDSAVELIASRIQKNLREIEGIFKKISFYYQQKKKPLVFKFIEQILNESTQEVANVNVTPAQVIRVVAEFFEISPQDIIGRSRKKEVVEPRQITVYLLKEMLGLSYVFIGKKLGERDHTTAIYAYEKMAGELNRSQSLQHKILSLKEIIQKGV